MLCAIRIGACPHSAECVSSQLVKTLFVVVVIVTLLKTSRFGWLGGRPSRTALRAVPKSQIVAMPLAARCPDMRRPDDPHAPNGKNDAARGRGRLRYDN